MHHEWTAPIGIVSIYCHPVEFFLSQIGEFIARVNNSLLWSRMFKPKFTDLLYVYVHVNNSKHILDVENSFTCQSPNYILFCRFWQTVKPKNASWCKLHLQPVSADIYVYLDREDIFLHPLCLFPQAPYSSELLCRNVIWLLLFSGSPSPFCKRRSPTAAITSHFSLHRRRMTSIISNSTKTSVRHTIIIFIILYRNDLYCYRWFNDYIRDGDA